MQSLDSFSAATVFHTIGGRFLSTHWEKHKQHFYWETDSDSGLAAYITTESTQYDLIDGLKDGVINLLLMQYFKILEVTIYRNWPNKALHLTLTSRASEHSVI